MCKMHKNVGDIKIKLSKRTFFVWTMSVLINKMGTKLRTKAE